MIRVWLFWIVAGVLGGTALSGCVRSGPAGGSEFGSIDDVVDIDGVYENDGDPEGRLSEILWGKTPLECNGTTVRHEEVESIAVSTSEDTVRVLAVLDGCTACERTYVLGRDLSIERGRIVLHERAFAVSRGGDDVMLGPSYEKAVIGLDVGGNALYESRGAGAGLVLTLIPAAFSEVSRIRFSRVRPAADYPPCGGQ